MAWTERRHLGFWKSNGTKGDPASLALFALHPGDCTDDGCWPSFDPESEDDAEIDLESELAEHLAEGQIAVLIQVGAEKLHYISGSAVAVDSTGKRIDLTLDSIYGKAAEAFGIQENEITRAEY